LVKSNLFGQTFRLRSLLHLKQYSSVPSRNVTQQLPILCLHSSMLLWHLNMPPSSSRVSLPKYALMDSWVRIESIFRNPKMLSCYPQVGKHKDP